MGIFNTRNGAPTWDTFDPRGEASMTSQRFNPILHGDMERNAAAVRMIETTLGPDAYGMTGATTKRNDNALGAYQVMRDMNLPKWSKDVFGREVSPGEFLASPEMQDEMFKAKFGDQQHTLASPNYGRVPEGKTATRAAGEWYGGPNFNPAAKDIHGKYDVTDYMGAFSSNLGSGAKAAPLDGSPIARPQMNPAATIAHSSTAPPTVTTPSLGNMLKGKGTDEQYGLLADALQPEQEPEAPMMQHQPRQGYTAKPDNTAYWRNRWLQKFGPTSGLYAMLSGGGSGVSLTQAEQAELAQFKASA